MLGSLGSEHDTPPAQAHAPTRHRYETIIVSVTSPVQAETAASAACADLRQALEDKEGMERLLREASLYHERFVVLSW